MNITSTIKYPLIVWQYWVSYEISFNSVSVKHCERHLLFKFRFSFTFAYSLFAVFIAAICTMNFKFLQLCWFYVIWEMSIILNIINTIFTASFLRSVQNELIYRTFSPIFYHFPILYLTDSHKAIIVTIFSDPYFEIIFQDTFQFPISFAEVGWDFLFIFLLQCIDHSSISCSYGSKAHIFFQQCVGFLLFCKTGLRSCLFEVVQSFFFVVWGW